MSVIACAWCGLPFESSGRGKFHSNSCRQTAYRARQSSGTPSSEPSARRIEIVYECPRCESRYLGIRRCPDCNLFCARIGPGGMCPHCDEPVALRDLES